VSNKKYGDPDFGKTLAELKLHAELAQTTDGFSIEGNARKVGAVLAVAGAGAELIAEIEQLQERRDELLAALEGLVRATDPDAGDLSDLLAKCNSAIAKAKGGAV
jgi:hypothetical protein